MRTFIFAAIALTVAAPITTRAAWPDAPDVYIRAACEAGVPTDRSYTGGYAAVMPDGTARLGATDDRPYLALGGSSATMKTVSAGFAVNLHVVASSAGHWQVTGSASCSSFRDPFSDTHGVPPAIIGFSGRPVVLALAPDQPTAVAGGGYT